MAKSGYLIKSLVKGYTVLELFKERNSLGITEIAKRLGMPKSTVFNIIYTFEELGYVRQLENDKYKLSTKIFELSQTVEFDLRNEAKPHLRELAEITNETINLVLHTEEKVLYTEKVESTEPININTKIGKKEDIYCTAVGKVILAYLDEDKQKQIFKKITFLPHTPNTITDLETLKKELSAIKDRGYAVDNEEFAKGVKCIGAPIFNHKGDPISAISITGPVARINCKKEKELADLVKVNANIISSKLGYSKNFANRLKIF